MSFFHNLNKTLASIAGKDSEAKTQATESVKQSELKTILESSYSAKAAAAGKDIGKPGKQFSKIAKSAGERYGSKAAGERVAGAVLNKLRNKTEEGNEFSGELAWAKAQHKDSFEVDGKTYPVKEEGMSAKEKSFAALAEPKDKITFADKIAGAKKEVDEMLGDVAADAMRNAIGKIREIENDEVEEGWDDMKQDVKKRMGDMSKMKPGDKMAGHKHDIEKTATGIKATRRTDADGISTGADDKDADGEKRGRGRPKGTGVKMGAKGPTGKSKLMTRENEGVDQSLRSDVLDVLQTIYNGAVAGEDMIDTVADELGDYFDDVDQSDDAMLKKAYAYVREEGADAEDDPELMAQIVGKAIKVLSQQGVGEAAPPGAKGERMTRENDDGKYDDEYDDEAGMAKQDLSQAKDAAEELRSILASDENLPEWVQAKITKAVDYLDTARDYVKSEKDGEEELEEKKDVKRDDKAEKAGKKVTKDIEHDEKEDKPKKSKGGIKFGEGVYEALDSQLESLINESMNVDLHIGQGPAGEPEESMTVTATGDDAKSLAEILRNAGMGSGSSCSVCGESECGCSEMVDENSPDWPTNQETSDDALQYAGGLNKPKSTGQTTTPVIASQLSRQVSMEESVKLERKLFDLYKDFTK